MNYVNKYDVIFSGLSIGKHDFVFEIDNKFFEQFDYSEIKQGKLLATVELNRMNTSMTAKVSINGNVVAACDRCLDDVEISIEYEGTLLIKHGEPTDDTDNSDDIMYLNRGDDTINFAQYIYESICISLPIQRVHADESDCNEDMIKRLKEITVK
ncbi:MAG: DUF177 domain-containing protein [Prevotellaceae bacterium]|jgi:uncharacterized metal-binding protein YceD (DUF177 family)|nr:DUF177 domain-containing protein [Prevotellaceae bacterium]